MTEFAVLDPAGDGKALAELCAAPKRPHKYDEEVAYVILARLGDGETLHAICADPGMPCAQTFYRWLCKTPDLQLGYHAAMLARFDKQAHELIQIAKDSRNDWMIEEGGDGIPVAKPNKGLIERTQMTIDTIKWVMGKELPRKYGEFEPSVPVQEAAALTAATTAAVGGPATGPEVPPPSWIARGALAQIRAEQTAHATSRVGA